MCGGINISQCVPQQAAPIEGSSKRMSLRPSILYNAGRVISYTVIGGIVGALGVGCQLFRLGKRTGSIGGRGFHGHHGLEHAEYFSLAAKIQS